MAAFHRWLDRISRLCLLLTGVALVVLTLIFGWLVYGRYVLNATPTWVEQLALLLVAYITFLGAAVGVHEGSHLSVDYLRTRCPRPLRRSLEMLTLLALASFGLVMAYAGYQLTVFKWGAKIPLLGVSEGVRAIPVAVGGALVALFALGHLLRGSSGSGPDVAPAPE